MRAKINVALEISGNAIKDARDSDDPKAALTNLILFRNP